MSMHRLSVTISEFLNAGKIEHFWLSFQPLFSVADLSSSSLEILLLTEFSQIWKQMAITYHFLPGLENMVDDAFFQVHIQVLQLV